MDMSYLQEKPIAILGGGATGRTQAADCTLGGRSVRLYELPEFKESLGTILENRCIKLGGPQDNLYGFRRDGVAEIDIVTTDMQTAVQEAGLVVISIPAVAFKTIFERLIPHLEDGQVIHFMTGNFGSLMLRRMMREAGCKKNVIMGEWSSMPYGTRIERQGGIQMPSLKVIYRAITLRGAALPDKDQDKFFESVKYLPSMSAVRHPVHGDTVVDIGFSNVNPILHVPGTLLGVSTMENYGVVFGDNKHDFSIYSHAYCPSISEVQYEVYQEECKIAEAMGVGIQPFEKEEFFSRSNILGAEFMGPGCKIPFEEQCEFAYGTGPFSIHNRYITEDVPVGCFIFYQLGKKFGIATPVIESMIRIASVMTKTDFFNSGVTLADLGIDQLSKDELTAYLHEGILP